MRSSNVSFVSVPALLATVAGSCCSAATAQPLFTPLGDLPGGRFESTATSVSADGAVVVGSAFSAVRSEAFRWSAPTGMVGLGSLPGALTNSVAFSVSADGSVIVGYSQSEAGWQAFRWTQASGMAGLGTLPGHVPDGGPYSVATGVSSDGLVVVGASSSLLQNYQAFRWTSTGGMMGLAEMPGDGWLNYAAGVSADGEVVVGFGDEAGIGSRAFRWAPGSGAADLGRLPGGTVRTLAIAVSADGGTVAGYGSSSNGTEAFRWTADGGIIALGDLAGGNFDSSAAGINADGSVIVGLGTTALGTEAFLWTPALGMVNLRDHLISLGVANLAGWQLSSARGVSADGSTVVGYGTNSSGQTEAWLARIPTSDCNPIAMPTEQSVVPGVAAVFSIPPSPGSATYRWRRNGVHLADGARIFGATSPSLTIAGVQSSDQGAYTCFLSGTCGEVTSSSAVLSCKPVFLQHPTGGAFAVGDTVVLTSQTSPASGVSFRWRKDGVNLFNGAVFTGVTTPRLTMNALDPSLSGEYSLVATDSCGSTISQPTEVSIYCPGDFNSDGGIDGTDVDAFYASWEAGESPADVNVDGGVDGADVSVFFERWEAGC
jgi:probable HAF family extracellular repeat protein